MRNLPDRLNAMIGPVVQGMGYELVGIEYLRHGRDGLLRIYIDHPGGVTLDDCSAVSHQVSGVLDVEDPIREHYDLEVSSPGLDRPLFTRGHFERFAGHPAKVSLSGKLDGRRRFTGVLRGVEDDVLLMEVDGEGFRLPLDQIESARLVPEL
ncbi:MAG: ribosome maturation factor RimP [Chromatiales bacterium]|jgi:ribosome maturation factor RimP